MHRTLNCWMVMATLSPRETDFPFAIVARPEIVLFATAPTTIDPIEVYYSGEPLPPHFCTVNCDRIFAPRLYNPERDGTSPPDECGAPQGLTELIELELVAYYLDNTIPPGLCQGLYFITQRPCGDCTALGSNIVPDFWEE